jgi:hypothetical protein
MKTQLVLVSVLCASCAQPQLRPSETSRAILIHSYADGLAGVRTTSSAMKLHVGRDSDMADEPVLFVDYPEPSADPASRDVQLSAASTNWSSGSAITFRIKPAHAIRLSISFVDRNRVVYTSWTNLRAAEWQSVRIALDAIRPNPYFQPPDAKQGSALDVSEVRSIGFAPQDPAAGSLTIGTIVVVK